jgi:3',5'-cyclic AMP phosphodiesterase CpdA
MKIAHISDTHIRNLKYHYEYKMAFADLYNKLKQMSPDTWQELAESTCMKRVA